MKHLLFPKNKRYDRLTAVIEKLERIRAWIEQICLEYILGRSAIRD